MYETHKEIIRNTVIPPLFKVLGVTGSPYKVCHFRENGNPHKVYRSWKCSLVLLELVLSSPGRQNPRESWNPSDSLIVKREWRNKGRV